MTARDTPTERARRLLAQGMEVMPKDHHITRVSAQWLESLQAVVADLADENDRLRAELDQESRSLRLAARVINESRTQRDELRAELDRRTDPDLDAVLAEMLATPLLWSPHGPGYEHLDQPHNAHHYDGSCAVCRFSDRPDARLIVARFIADAARLIDGEGPT